MGPSGGGREPQAGAGQVGGAGQVRAYPPLGRSEPGPQEPGPAEMLPAHFLPGLLCPGPAPSLLHRAACGCRAAL